MDRHEVRAEVRALVALGPLPVDLGPGESDRWDEYEPLLPVLKTLVTDAEALELVKLFPRRAGDDHYGLAYRLIETIRTAPGWPGVVLRRFREAPPGSWLSILLHVAERDEGSEAALRSAMARLEQAVDREPNASRQIQMAELIGVCERLLGRHDDSNAHGSPRDVPTIALGIADRIEGFESWPLGREVLGALIEYADYAGRLEPWAGG